MPAGVADGGKDDKIIYDIDASGKSASGFGHPVCDNPPAPASPTSMQFIGVQLPQTFPIGN